MNYYVSYSEPAYNKTGSLSPFTTCGIIFRFAVRCETLLPRELIGEQADRNKPPLKLRPPEAAKSSEG